MPVGPAPRLTASRRRWRRRVLLTLLAPAMLQISPVGAAPFAARATASDPPTGDNATVDLTVAEEPLIRGTGIRWSIAPWRWAGSVSLDVRRVRGETGFSTSSGVITGDIDFASYVWQPWFIQLRGGVGLVLDRSRSSGGDSSAASGSGRGFTARAGVSVFPASRFPFEARFDVGDSRAGGETLISHFRTLRLGLSQSWTPAVGNDNWRINFDHSRVSGDNGVGDTLTALAGNGILQRGDHHFDLGANWSVNSRKETDDKTQQALLSARHAWQDNKGLAVDSVASWNDLSLRLGSDGSRLSLDTRLIQLSTVASWRPTPGQWLYDEAAPLVVTAAVRVLDSNTGTGGISQGARNFSLTAGASKEFSREWRGNLGLSLNRLDGSGGASSSVAAITGTLVHMPAPVTFGQWRWTPSAALNLSLSDAPEGGQRTVVGLQGAHGVNRSWVPFDGQSVGVNVSQSLAVLHESPAGNMSRGVSHSAGMFWQGGGERGQTAASLTVSDSRSYAEVTGQYQFANLQVTHRTNLSRYQSLSANLTLQASRSDVEQLDAFTGQRRLTSDGWQRYTSGTVSFESQRVFGVPRLRFTSVLTLNSQQLERRSAGDFDAPLERVTESLEARLDWVVGRLDTRLSARLVRIDGRMVSALAARAVRRF